jgi:hypothetical protein
MKTKNADLRELREEVSSESSRNIDFENMLRALLENPCDENLDLINRIRANFAGSSTAIEDIIAKLQSLTWTLREPTVDDLKSVADLIFLGRQLVRGTASIINSYQPLWQKGVIITETREFQEVSEHLTEVLDDIESVYFKLPNLPGFNDTTHELESL